MLNDAVKCAGTVYKLSDMPDEMEKMHTVVESNTPIRQLAQEIIDRADSEHVNEAKQSCIKTAQTYFMHKFEHVTTQID
jgi:hypothetical protein